METKFSQVAHLYLWCMIQYPNPDGGKPIVAKLTGVTSDGFETTYKRKKNGCNGDLIGFKDGKERGHQTYAENCKPILRHLSDITEEDREALSQILLIMDINSYADAIMVDAAKTTYLLSKGYDLHNLIETGQAINAKKD